MQKTDLTINAKFKSGDEKTVFIIDDIENHEKFGKIIHSSIEGGKKGNYQDTEQDFFDFLIEQNCKKI